jgi:hypothetical protein
MLTREMGSLTVLNCPSWYVAKRELKFSHIPSPLGDFHFFENGKMTLNVTIITVKKIIY